MRNRRRAAADAFDEVVDLIGEANAEAFLSELGVSEDDLVSVDTYLEWGRRGRPVRISLRSGAAWIGVEEKYIDSFAEDIALILLDLGRLDYDIADVAGCVRASDPDEWARNEADVYAGEISDDMAAEYAGADPEDYTEEDALAGREAAYEREYEDWLDGLEYDPVAFLTERGWDDSAVERAIDRGALVLDRECAKEALAEDAELWNDEFESGDLFWVESPIE